MPDDPIDDLVLFGDTTEQQYLVFDEQSKGLIVRVYGDLGNKTTLKHDMIGITFP